MKGLKSFVMFHMKFVDAVGNLRKNLKSIGLKPESEWSTETKYKSEE